MSRVDPDMAAIVSGSRGAGIDEDIGRIVSGQRRIDPDIAEIVQGRREVPSDISRIVAGSQPSIDPDIAEIVRGGNVPRETIKDDGHWETITGGVLGADEDSILEGILTKLGITMGEYFLLTSLVKYGLGEAALWGLSAVPGIGQATRAATMPMSVARGAKLMYKLKKMGTLQKMLNTGKMAQKIERAHGGSARAARELVSPAAFVGGGLLQAGASGITHGQPAGLIGERMGEEALWASALSAAFPMAGVIGRTGGELLKAPKSIYRHYASKPFAVAKALDKSKTDALVEGIASNSLPSVAQQLEFVSRDALIKNAKNFDKDLLVSGIKRVLSGQKEGREAIAGIERYAKKNLSKEASDFFYGAKNIAVEEMGREGAIRKLLEIKPLYLTPLLKYREKTVKQLFYAAEETAAKPIGDMFRRASFAKGISQESFSTAAKKFDALPHETKLMAMKLMPELPTIFKGSIDESWLAIEGRKAALKTLGPGEANVASSMVSKMNLESVKGWQKIPEEARKQLTSFFKEIGNAMEVGFRNASPVRRLKTQVTALEQMSKLTAMTSGLKGTALKDAQQALEKVIKNTGKAGRYDYDSLKKIIENNEYPLSVREYTKDVHDFSINLANKGPLAIYHSHLSGVVDTVSNLKKYVSTVERPDLKLFKLLEGKDTTSRMINKAFRGKFVHQDIDELIESAVYLPTFAMSQVNKMFARPWKMGKVVMNPAAHPRNIYSNVHTNHWGGFPMWRVDIYSDAFQGMWKNVRGEAKDPRLENFLKTTGYGQTFASVEGSILPSRLKSNYGPGDWMLHLLDMGGGKQMSQAFQFEEVWVKYAKYLHNLEIGMTDKAAIRDSLRWTLNYSERSPFVQDLSSTAMPFATWTFKVLPLFAETLVKHPQRLLPSLAIPAVITAAALHRNGISNEEWEELKHNLPEWQRGGVVGDALGAVNPLVGLMPFRSEDGRLYVTTNGWMIAGFGDIADIASQRVPVLGTLVQHPLINLWGALQNNRKFSGAPIYNEHDTGTEKAIKMFTQGYMEFAPALYSSTVKMLAKDYLIANMQESTSARTSAETAAYLGGIKMKAIDPQEVRMRHFQHHKRVERAAKSEFRKVLKEFPGNSGLHREKRKKALFRLSDDMIRNISDE